MTYEFSIQPGEYWWGGTAAPPAEPITEQSVYELDYLHKCGNQTMPFFVSSMGRYIWSERPFLVNVHDGVFHLQGKDIVLYEAGNTLKDAYLEAMHKHFPCNGQQLPEVFFLTAQYNTWMEFDYHPAQGGILSFARGWIENGYAPGVFIIDEGWHKRYGEWDFDRARFPDPKAMVEELHRMGFTVLLWVVPYVSADGYSFVRSLQPSVDCETDDAGNLYLRNQEDHVAIMNWWNGFSAVLDLTDADNCAFLDGQLKRLIEEYGIDGFKCDGGSPIDYSDESVINGGYKTQYTPHELNTAWNRFADRYSMHEHKDTWKGGGINTIQRLRDKHHTWDGNGIKSLIPCAITCGLIGHPFICPDMVGGGEWKFNYIPGFHVDEELFVRMAQCSALFPMIQFSWAPWRLLSLDNQEACKQMALLHQKMACEIITLVKSAEKSGEPIIRSLEYNDPHQGYESIVDEFMLGEDILVAPVLQKGVRSRTVLFPAGRWIDEEGHEYIGRSAQILEAPLHKLLWFRKIAV